MINMLMNNGSILMHWQIRRWFRDLFWTIFDTVNLNIAQSETINLQTSTI